MTPEESEQKRAERFALKEVQRVSDLRKVLATAEGRRLYWRLMDVLSGVFGPSMQADANLTAYGEGRRSVGLSMIREAQEHAAREYAAMVIEQMQAAEEESAFSTQNAPKE